MSFVIFPSMKVTTKWILGSLGAAIILSAGFSGYYLWQMAFIGTAYKAKTLCSCVFISNRDPASILSEDLLADDLRVFKRIDAEIDSRE